MLGPPKARRVDRPVRTSLEALVPPGNFYRHLAKVLDLAFVRELVRDRCAVGGPPPQLVAYYRALVEAGMRYFIVHCSRETENLRLLGDAVIPHVTAAPSLSRPSS